MLNKNFLHTILQDFISIFYPKKCLFCRDVINRISFDYICDDCFDEIKFFEINEDCKAVFCYTELAKKAIHSFKYNDKPFYAKYFGDMMCKYLECAYINRFDVLIPVPMHKIKQRKRGYNQAELLANIIGKRFSLPVDKSTLVRQKNTIAQSKISFDERDKNLEGAFKVIDENKIKGKSILLVDDVYTSGSTIRYCRNILLENGAENVDYFVLSKTLGKINNKTQFSMEEKQIEKIR